MSQLSTRLNTALSKGQRTLLGVGPMSRLCVESTLELAHETDAPLMLIASRRQVDCAAHGGGYVENWSTEAWSRFVRERDPEGKVVLCRDHGGPWQGTGEGRELDLKAAMKRAKESYDVDIASGLQVIHIDPSIDPHGTPGLNAVLERVYELYEHCWATAQRLGKDIVFEVGTEEQECATGDVNTLGDVLGALNKFCTAHKMPLPQFVVAQTGTKVMETKNIGVFGAVPMGQSLNAAVTTLHAEVTDSTLKNLVAQLNRGGVCLKQHNTDYLDNPTLSRVPTLGVHAANVAPEFGVEETRALLKLMKDNGLDTLHERFVALSYGSRKWDKWMMDDTAATDYDRAVISGHYVFAKPEGVEIRAEAARALAGKGIDLDAALKSVVKQSIRRYMVNFNLC